RRRLAQDAGHQVANNFTLGVFDEDGHISRPVHRKRDGHLVAGPGRRWLLGELGSRQFVGGPAGPSQRERPNDTNGQHESTHGQSLSTLTWLIALVRLSSSNSFCSGMLFFISSCLALTRAGKVSSVSLRP